MATFLGLRCSGATSRGRPCAFGVGVVDYTGRVAFRAPSPICSGPAIITLVVRCPAADLPVHLFRPISSLPAARTLLRIDPTPLLFLEEPLCPCQPPAQLSADNPPHTGGIFRPTAWHNPVTTLGRNRNIQPEFPPQDFAKEEPRRLMRVVQRNIGECVATTKHERYLRYATECVRLAHQATPAREKDLLLRMAETWRQLAQKPEAEEPELQSE